MGEPSVAKQIQVIDLKDSDQHQRVIDQLMEENRSLRRAASAFGELAERLNVQLQEARRASRRAGEESSGRGASESAQGPLKPHTGF
jgi:hypothetical protein